MTDTTQAGPMAPLGVGEIISSSFSIMFGNIVKVFLLGFAGAFLGWIVTALFLGFGFASGSGEVAPADPGNFIFGVVASTVISLVIYGLVTALLIQLAYDAKLGRSNTIGAYFSGAMPAILPIALLSIVVGILAMVGAIALIIGALWVYAVFYVMAPVAVIEKGGFGSMGRSSALTKEYRWPIVGLIIILAVLSFLLQLVGGFLVGIIGSPVVGGIVLALFNGLAYGFGGIVIALVYARLREIKEGVDVDQIVAVFE